MAEIAAEKMANAAFGDKIGLAKQRVTVVVEGLVCKYIPYSIRAIVAEFPSYFEKRKYVTITTTLMHSDESEGHEYSIGSQISFWVPKGSEYIGNVSAEEYRELKKLYMDLKNIEKAQREFEQQVLDALCALRTEKKVKESLPEALPYIEFPEDVQLPAPVFGTLRQIIKNIKTDDNEEKK